MSKAVLPSRMNLAIFKLKKVGAKKGFDLLKSKSDALKVISFLSKMQFFRLVIDFNYLYHPGPLQRYLQSHLQYEDRHV